MPRSTPNPLASALLAICLAIGAQHTRAATPSAVAPSGSADTSFINGKILTVDAQFSIASEIAIKGDRILAVGTAGATRSVTNASTRVIDLKGKTLIPGLIDNHIHFIRAPQRWNLQARIDGINSRAQALAVIAAKVKTMKPGEWLMVQGGWGENQFADQPGGFTLAELDAVAPDNPLFLQITYQTVYANSLALRAVDVDPAKGAKHGGPVLISPKPPYGSLNEKMPTVTSEQLETNVMDVMATLNRSGLTSVYDVGRPPEGDITLLDRMARKAGPLPLRVWHTLKYEAFDAGDVGKAVDLITASKPNSTDDYLGLLGVGEHVYLPMFDLPNVTQPFSPEIVADFEKIAMAAAKRGFSVHEHSMMDVTIKSILDSYENIDRQISIRDMRWTLAHVLTISDESIRRSKALGLTAAVHSVAMYLPPNLQPPIRKIQDSGIVWGLGTDASIVAHYQPFITLGWVVSGKSINGKTLIKDTITREEALIAHTRSNAFLLFKEKDLGTLEAGKLADLVVLDKDYMTVPADEIFNIKPLMTMVGGRIVFDAQK